MSGPSPRGGGAAAVPPSLVVDASVAVKWFVHEEWRDQAMLLLGGPDLRAPGLMRTECANILWKKARRGEIPRVRAGHALAELAEVPIRWLDDAPHVAGALRRALSLDHPAYDCVYLEVAAGLRLPLVTADRRLAGFSGRDGATVLHLDSFAASAGPSLAEP